MRDEKTRRFALLGSSLDIGRRARLRSLEISDQTIQSCALEVEVRPERAFVTERPRRRPVSRRN